VPAVRGAGRSASPTSSGGAAALTGATGGGTLAPTTDGAAAAAPEAAAPAGAAGVESSLALSESGLPTTSSQSIYLVVAGAALLAALALHGLRQLGVRAPARI